MQPVSRLAAPARVGTATSTRQARASATATTSRAWPCVRVVAPAPRPCLRLRARATTSCGGGGKTEPVEAREDNAGPAAVVGDEAEAGLAPEELEEAAIAGVDEGRRPMDYDRRAHIFEESSRVFREIKHQQDGDGGSGHGGAADPTAATEAGTAGARE